MPITTEYTSDGRGAIQVCTGVVTIRQFIEELHRQHTDPLRPKGHAYVLVDFTDTTSISASPVDLAQLVREQQVVARDVPKFDLAIIAPSDLIFGVARMWENMAIGFGWEGRIVRTREEAIAWLRSRHTDITVV